MILVKENPSNKGGRVEGTVQYDKMRISSIDNPGICTLPYTLNNGLFPLMI